MADAPHRCEAISRARPCATLRSSLTLRLPPMSNKTRAGGSFPFSRAPRPAPHPPPPAAAFPAPLLLLLEGGERLLFAFPAALARAGFRPAGRSLGAGHYARQVPKMAPVSGAVRAGASYWAVLSRCCGRVVVAPRFGGAAYSSVLAVNSGEGRQREGESGPARSAVAAGGLGLRRAGGGWLRAGGKLRPVALLPSRLQAALKKDVLFASICLRDFV